jgi:hypothetical protein
MRQSLIILFLSITLSANGQVTDKQAHMICGGIAGSFGYLVGSYNEYNDLKPIAYGTLFYLAAGTGKELVWDKWYRRTKFDLEDLKATIKGGLVTVFVVEVIVLGGRAISHHRSRMKHYMTINGIVLK